MKENLVLLGFPCCGKTTAGGKTADLLKIPFIDTDCEIEKALGMNRYDVVRAHGLVYFREAEEKIICSLSPKKAVVSLGGGAVLSAKNCHHLKQIGLLIYLYAPFETVVKRNLERKPMPTYIDPDDPHGSLLKLYETREIKYREAAEIILDTTGLSIDEIVQELIYGK